MVEILFACVNYDSYSYLDKYLDSIRDALINYPMRENLNVSVCISDNSENKLKIEKKNGLNIIVVPNQNVGYLGGIMSALSHINTHYNTLDFLIVSNVDVEVSKDFFEQLLAVQINEEIGWIAPSILSESERKDRNPKVISRYGISKLKILKFMYRFPILHFIYESILYPLKRNTEDSFQRQYIYAGHGSFMIFTSAFLRRVKEIFYPIFLFGEELYFAEECRLNDLKVEYIPSIKVYDTDHVSTSKMKRKSYYKYNFDAINYIYEQYYK